jgi:hypothetical protein
MDILTDAGPGEPQDQREGQMIEDVRPTADGFADFVELASAGEPGAGAYRCAECRYGISLACELPSCPMCGGTVWEPTGVPLAAADLVSR